MSRCINTILHHYLIAAIFTAGDGEFDHYGADDFTEEARAKSREDIESFLQQAKAQNIDTSLWSDEMLGHDFSLTRNGHGTGFWDRFSETPEPGDALSAIAQQFGEVHVYDCGDGTLSLE